LEYDYIYGLASLFYRKLIDVRPEDGKKLHDSYGFKFFTFSRLEIPQRRATKDGLEILSDCVFVWFSSPDDSLARSIANSMIQTERLTVGGVEFTVTGLSFWPKYDDSRTSDTFTTMSPVMTRTIRDTPVGPKLSDLEASDPDFVQNIVANLSRKYEAFQGCAPTEPLEIVEIRRLKRKLVTVRNTTHKGYMMELDVEGPGSLLSFAYDVGLGEKNSMGFGMVRCLDDLVKADKGEGNP